MAEGDYAAAVKQTFETRPLRTVLMIDDQFPTYANLLESGDEEFKESDRALALYQGFKARHMVCDVENKVGGMPAESLRKSDLIVLDYNLGPSANDNDRAINILRDLAGTKHFNSIVVYTSEPDQDRVWMEIAASLAGGWSSSATLSDAAQAEWDRLSDGGQLPAASREAQLAVVTADMRSFPGDERARLRAELHDLGVPGGLQNEIIKSLVHRELARLAGSHADADRHLLRGKRSPDGPRWIQCRNCFVAILRKGDIQPENEQDPAGIMDCLGNALLDWRPNLFQILISEMQNILELEALVTEDEHLRDPVTQTALWYYLLDSLGQIDLTSEDLARPSLAGVVDKIVDGMRRRLSSDPELLAMAGKAMIEELATHGWAAERPARATKELFGAAHTMARPPHAEQTDVMFRLNSFLCTEPFRRTHLTTGSVFREAEGDTFWVAASPACDLVARKPSGFQKWAHQLHPTFAMTALRLEPAELKAALRKAELGHFVFLEIAGEKKAFRVLDPNTGQPVYEILFPNNEGRITDGEGGPEFAGSRLLAGENAEDRSLSPGRFVLIAQLRAANANRILQLAGQHVSRIAMDFINMTDT